MLDGSYFGSRRGGRREKYESNVVHRCVRGFRSERSSRTFMIGTCSTLVVLIPETGIRSMMFNQY